MFTYSLESTRTIWYIFCFIIFIHEFANAFFFRDTQIPDFLLYVISNSDVLVRQPIVISFMFYSFVRAEGNPLR